MNDHSTAFDEKKVKELLGDQMYLLLNVDCLIPVRSASLFIVIFFWRRK